MKVKNAVEGFKNMFMSDKKEVESKKSLQARIVVSELEYNNSVMIMDENGEWRTAPVPDPVEEEFVVKQGDKVKGFEILEVLENFIELKSFMEYTTGAASAPETHFIIAKGEGINLNMYGVYDAVCKISINYVETVE